MIILECFYVWLKRWLKVSKAKMNFLNRLNPRTTYALSSRGVMTTTLSPIPFLPAHNVIAGSFLPHFYFCVAKRHRGTFTAQYIVLSRFYWTTVLCTGKKRLAYTQRLGYKLKICSRCLKNAILQCGFAAAFRLFVVDIQDQEE